MVVIIMKLFLKAYAVLFQNIIFHYFENSNKKLLFSYVGYITILMKIIHNILADNYVIIFGFTELFTRTIVCSHSNDT